MHRLMGEQEREKPTTVTEYLEYSSTPLAKKAAKRNKKQPPHEASYRERERERGRREHLQDDDYNYNETTIVYKSIQFVYLYMMSVTL